MAMDVENVNDYVDVVGVPLARSKGVLLRHVRLWMAMVIGLECMATNAEFAFAPIGESTEAIITGWDGPYPSDNLIIPSVVLDERGEDDFRWLTVTEIASWAFCCLPTTVVTIPNTVRVIGSHAFESADVQNLVFDEGSTLERIEEYAFSCCGKLKRVTLPSDLTYIGKRAFEFCDDLRIVDLDDIAMWCNITLDGSPIQPEWDEITGFSDDGMPIWTIHPRSQLYYRGAPLKRLQIPNSVSEIRGRAFFCCDALEELLVSDSVKKIGFCAFGGCNHLRTVSLGNGVEEIGESAFSGDSSLREVYFGSNLKSVQYGVFMYCENLEKICVANLDSWLDINWLSYFSNPFYKSSEKCFLYIGGVVSTVIRVPEGRTSILAGTFWGMKNLKTVIIPSSVKTIGEDAFSECGIVSLDIPDGVEEVGMRAFFGCDKLSKLVIRHRDTYSNVMTNLFRGVWSDDDLTISPLEVCADFYPNGLDLSKVEKLTIPEGAKESGERLYLPSNVKEVEFPSTLTVATNLIRGGIKYAVAADNPAYVSDGDHCLLAKDRSKFLAYSNKDSSHYRVGIWGSSATTIKEIGDKAFWNCDNLRYLEIPSSIERIGESAFEGLPGLVSVTFDGVNRTKLSTNCAHDVTMIGNQIQRIGKRAFYNCPKLRNVSSLPDTLSSLGDGSFANCPELTSLWFWGGPPGVVKTNANIGVFSGSGVGNGGLVGYYMEDMSNKWAKVLGGTNWWQGAYFVMDETKKIAYEEPLPSEVHSWLDGQVDGRGYDGENLSKVIWNTTSAQGFRTDAEELKKAYLLGIEPKMSVSGKTMRLHVNSEFSISDWQVHPEQQLAEITATIKVNEGRLTSPFAPVAMPLLWVTENLTKPWQRLDVQPEFTFERQDDQTARLRAVFDLSGHTFSKIVLE